MKKRICAVVLALTLSLITPIESFAAAGNGSEEMLPKAVTTQPEMIPEEESQVTPTIPEPTQPVPTENPNPDQQDPDQENSDQENPEQQNPDNGDPNGEEPEVSVTPTVSPTPMDPLLPQTAAETVEVPVLLTYGAGDTIITGTSVAGYEIVVQIGVNTYRGTVDEQGVFGITVPALGENVDITAYALFEEVQSELVQVNTGYIEGWTTDGRYREKDGTYRLSQWIDRYYVNSQGYRLKAGWHLIENVWYYMDSTCQRVESKWLFLKNIWYWMKADGSMATGWADVGNQRYYFNGSGAMQTGWKWISGTWYYLNKGGSMKTGWLKQGKKWYYLKPETGIMAVGWVKVGTYWFYTNASGEMQTGWKYIGGKWYYLNGGGSMRTGWFKSGSRWYYLNPEGDMAIGWRYVEGKWYFLNDSGVMQTGWQKIKQKWYYFYGNGSSVDPGSAKIIDGKYYIFNENCALYSHWSAQRRYQMVSVAQGSVGRIPYYWGGYASYPGYTGNNFGSKALYPDHIGRTLKGMDCSHWVDWVCWTAFGNNLGNGYTGVIADKSTRITESQLLPGDLGFMGDYPYTHVGMYVGNGYFIHLNGTASNVSLDNVKRWTTFYRLDCLR